MAYKVNSLEEMPNALSYLIESVEALQSKVNALQNKQASNSPKWSFVLIYHRILPSKRFMDGFQPNKSPYIK